MDNRQVSYDVQGELPKPPKEAQAPKILPYIRRAPEAIRFRDEGLTFREIGERLDVHGVTAVRLCEER